MTVSENSGVKLSDDSRFTGFNEVFDHKRLTETHRFIGSNTSVADALIVVKALTSAQGKFRGEVFAGSLHYNGTEVRYLITHGDYGYVILRSDDRGLPVMFVADEYLTSCKLSELTHVVKDLTYRSIVTGVPLYAIMQWFDSTFRLANHKHVSPHFKPAEALTKLWTNISPAINLAQAKGSTLLHLYV